MSTQASAAPEPSGSSKPTLWAWVGLAAVLGGGLLRAALAVGDDGVYWPDEIFQSFEPAHRLVYGYGLVAWEFIDGARNWALPGLVAGLMALLRVLGLDQPHQYVPAVKLAFACLGTATVYACQRLARAVGAPEWAAALGALAFALAAPAIYFSPRAMSETAAALPLVLGLAYLLDPSSSRRAALVGAGLLGLSVLLRLQCAVFAVGALAVLFASRRRQRALDTLGVLAVSALAFGALDALTWSSAPSARFGGFFHSAVRYLEFNLVEGKASGWGTAPWHFYFTRLFASAPGLSLTCALLTLVGARRAPGLFALTLAFVALHAAVAHKELRFVYPALPLLAALAAAGLGALRGRLALVGGLAVALSAVLSGVHHRSLTFGDLGQYPDRPQASAYDDFGPVNRMLLAASQRSDVCGLRVDLAHLAWTGGHTYLHRPVPLYHAGHPPLEAGLFNHLITVEGNAPGEVVARDPRSPQVVLLRLPFVPTCRPDPGYSWRLP